MKRLLCPLIVLSLLFTLAGCSKHDHSHSGGGHVHKAPHGGQLIELGEHAYNLELVRDTATGTLTAYLLDGHAENFVRIAAPAIDLTAFSGGQKRTLSLKAIANSVTGETVGNTSQFAAQADWLTTGGELNGEIGAIEIRGTKFKPAAFQLK
jgi:hypothetical protein